MNKAKILYVEDDETLGFVTKDNLELNNFQVDHCNNGDEALQHFKKWPYDLCLFDVMLPKMDGFNLAKEVRKINAQIPILFLTAKSLKEDRIQGLELGADDYITKPFSIEELILRIEVFLKRKFVTNPIVEEKLELGDYHLDYENLKLSFQNELVKKLTEKEANLLKLLLQNKDHILKRSVILKELWGEDDYFLGRSMDVFISRLRKCLRHDPSIKIENVHGVGFRLIREGD